MLWAKDLETAVQSTYKKERLLRIDPKTKYSVPVWSKCSDSAEQGDNALFSLRSSSAIFNFTVRKDLLPKRFVGKTIIEKYVAFFCCLAAGLRKFSKQALKLFHVVY